MFDSANMGAEAPLLTLLDLADAGVHRASVGADIEDSGVQAVAGDVSPTVGADFAIGADLEPDITIRGGSMAADMLGGAIGADVEDADVGAAVAADLLNPDVGGAIGADLEDIDIRGASVAADLVNTVADRSPSLGADQALDGPSAAADMGTTGGSSAAADVGPTDGPSTGADLEPIGT